MRVLPIDHRIHLPADKVVDLLLLQLHTPAPLEAGGPGHLATQFAAGRGVFLQRLGVWLQAEFCQRQPPERPLFVVTPELSVSLEHVALLTDIAGQMNRPTVFIAGLEFLEWAEYCQLMGQLNDMQGGDEWQEGGAPDRKVNAALIIVRDGAGNVQRFLQPKCNASAAEVATHFCCQAALFFLSENQSGGTRFNWSVHVCSDFVSQDHIREFRTVCDQAIDSRPVDLGIVVQRNPDQNAEHFKKCVETYFSPANGMVATNDGALLFVNCASEKPGTSALWGASKLLVPHGTRWQPLPASTYWLDAQGAFNYRAAVVREPGPTIYWFRYKPHYLESTIPGSGWPAPFVQGHAQALAISDYEFPDTVEFVPLPPVGHWLISQWGGKEDALREKLGEIGANAGVIEGCMGAYRPTFELFEAVFTPPDTSARSLMVLYYLGVQGVVLNDGQLVEPQGWDGSVVKSVSWFFWLFTILRAGLPELHPRPGAYAHGELLDTAELTLVWGDDRPVQSLIPFLVRHWDEVDPSGQARRGIFVRPQNPQEPDALQQMVEDRSESIVRPLGDEPAGDDITQADEIDRQFLCDQTVWDRAAAQESMTELTTALRAVLCL